MLYLMVNVQLLFKIIHYNCILWILNLSKLKKIHNLRIKNIQVEFSLKTGTSTPLFITK
jgi:hypothetical protein